ncbi:MAG TPA: ABC transporter ATP-binding protein [Candidatus Sumerlaeota bacterium]|nr:ABC transporter ATP-binding protein [Candidatus Sumerlaeota bacterium]HPK02841.1 ABC transporter ATP-binding protein [Candidatus Sumerlaeota bacterium]
MSLLPRLLPRLWAFKFRLLNIAILSVVAGFLGAFSLIAFKPIIEVMFYQPGEAIEGPQVSPLAPPEDAGSPVIPLPSKIAEKVQFYKNLVQNYVAGHQEAAKQWMLHNKVHALILIGIILLVAQALGAYIKYVVEVMTAKIGLGIQKDLKDELFEHIVRQDMPFFSRTSTGQIMARLQNDTRKVQRMLMDFTGSTVIDFFNVIGLLCVLLYLSPRLTIYAAVTLPILGGLFYFTGRAIRKLSDKAEEHDAGVFHVSQEALSGIAVVKAFGADGHEVKRFKQATAQTNRRLLTLQRVQGFVGPANDFLSTLAVVLTLVMGGILFLGDRNYLGPDFQTADFTIYLLAITRFYRPIKGLLKLNVTYHRGMASLARIYRIMDIQPTILDAPDAVDLPDRTPRVEFHGVTFAYPRRRNPQPVLENFNLEVEPGEVVALVGPSGAGKTTLINLICRFYDVQEGVVRIAGHDVRHLRQQSLRDRIAIVPQETFLFNDTIHENIAYGRTDATRAEVEQAARLAHAHHFIAALPDGYDTVVGERGGKLSTGQKQRLAIARALLKNPTILIFDEATASLDAETERQIRDSMRLICRGRTTFIIAHRFSTVMMADRIVVLENGRIVEQGSHETLYEAGGLYARLCNIQGIFVDTPPEATLSGHPSRSLANGLG